MTFLTFEGGPPSGAGTFAAIDVETGDHEMVEDDYAAVARSRARKPVADVADAARLADNYRDANCRSLKRS